MAVHRRAVAVPLLALTVATLLVAPAAAPSRATSAATAPPTPLLEVYAGGDGFGEATNVSHFPGSVDVVGDRILTVDAFPGDSLPAPEHAYAAYVRATDLSTGQLSVLAGDERPGAVTKWGVRVDGVGEFTDGPAVGRPLSASRATGDEAGNVYITDPAFPRVRMITPTGAIVTIAGTGTPGFSGDGGPATAATLADPHGLAVGPDGSIYFADTGNHRVRRISPDGLITTVAGTGTPGGAGDGGPATLAQLTEPTDIDVDTEGNLYIADGDLTRVGYDATRIRVVSPTGAIRTLADGLQFRGIAVEAPGRLLIAGAAILRLDASGAITTVAGKATEWGFAGDGGTSLADVRFAGAWDVAVDAAGNIYVADVYNRRIRRITPAGAVSTVSGNGERRFSGDGGPAVGARFNSSVGLSASATGTYFHDSRYEHIRHVDPAGIIRTVRSGKASTVAADAAGNLYIAEQYRVLKRSPDGFETVVAGTGEYAGSLADGIRATDAKLLPGVIAVDGRGDLFVVDTRFNPQQELIRRVDANGTITTVAGGGAGNPYPPAYPALAGALELDAITDLAFGPDGTLSFIANGQLLRLACGVIGNHPKGAHDVGTGYVSLAVDRDGNVFIGLSNAVQKLTPDGRATHVAGGGTAYPDEGVPATAAELYSTYDLGLDGAGNVLIGHGERIFKVAGQSAGVAVPGPYCSLGGAPAAPVPALGGDRFTPVPATRVLDTRRSVAVGPNSSVSAKVTGTGTGGVPEVGVSAVLVNVTVTQPTTAGYVNVVPSGTPGQGRSTLTFAAGQTVANLTVAKVGTDGRIDLYNSAGQTHVIVDIAGWYGPGAATRFTSTQPIRALDTRKTSSPLGPGASRTVQLAPIAGATAVVFNLTATQPTAMTYVSAYEAGAARPATSNLNVAAGQTMANLVVAKLSPDGRIDLFNAAGTTHAIVDVVGWYGGSGGQLNSLAPTRVLDTRRATGGSGAVPVGAGQSIRLPVAGANGVPAFGASAVAVIVTVTQPTAPSYLVAWGTDDDRPLTSNLNFQPGQTVSNLVVTSLGSNGEIQLFNFAGSTHVVVDLVGWYGART